MRSQPRIEGPGQHELKTTNRWPSLIGWLSSLQLSQMDNEPKCLIDRGRIGEGVCDIRCEWHKVRAFPVSLGILSPNTTLEQFGAVYSRMQVSEEFGYMIGYMTNVKAIGFVRRSLCDGLFAWLGDRDSNPNYLIQSQAFYR